MLKQVQHDDLVVQPPAPELVARFEAGLRAEPEDRLALAVSGGGDSLALLLLAHAARPGRVCAATVDHRMRPEGAIEAAMVARVCSGLGVPHTILTAGAPLTGNLQSAARELRYRLLGEWAWAAGCRCLLTAHQLDDQAETLLMRLNRGAGVGGLAGVRAKRPLDAGGLILLRPLLTWRRAELAAVVAAAGLTPVQDPSNGDLRFDRARLRVALAEADWLDPASLARSAAALGEAEAALAWATDRLAGERLHEDAGALCLAPADLPPELLRRLVARAVSQLDPAAAPLRGESLDRLIASLRLGTRAMLGNVLAEPGTTWRFVPAPPRRLR